MKCTIETLKKASTSILFEMSEEQYKVLLDEFQTIIKQLSILDDLGDLNSVIPMDFPFETTIKTLREDESGIPVQRKDILKNAGDSFANQIRVPKVVK